MSEKKTAESFGNEKAKKADAPVSEATAAGLSTAATDFEGVGYSQSKNSTTKQGDAPEKTRQDIQAAFFLRTRTKLWPRALAFLIDIPFICIIAAGIAATTDLASADILFGPSIVAAFSSIIYHTFTESSPWQATIGKKVIGLRTMRVNGGRITAWRALLRSFARVSNWITLGVADTICLLFGERAVYHDLVSRTRTYDSKLVMAGDIEKLGLGNDKDWGIKERALAGVALTFNVIVWLYFAMMVYYSAAVRENLTKAYENVAPALAAVKAHHDKGNVFPSSMAEIKQDIAVSAAGLKSVEYVSGKGIFLLTMDKSSGFDGVMYVAPVVNVPGMRGKVTWVCGSVQPILQNHLPSSCPSRERLALRILIDREKAKETP